MKKISLFISLLLLIGCSKKEPGPTTFSITNSSSNTLYGFTTYYYDGANYKELTQHGDLDPGASTEFTTTAFDAIDFYFSYDPQGVDFYSVTSFTLNQHVKNLFDITDNTELDGGTTFYVYNQSDQELFNVESFSLSGSTKDNIINLGDLPSGTRSTIEYANSGETYLEFQLVQGGDTYRVNNPYTISDGVLNVLNINNSTSVTNLTATTYKIVNNSDFELFNLTSFYSENSQTFDEVNHGNLISGSETNDISTSRSTISVTFELVNGGDVYIVSPDFDITSGESNPLEISNSTQVINLTTGKIEKRLLENQEN